jgi:23S rRNA pseudouridine2457 synthase
MLIAFNKPYLVLSQFTASQLGHRTLAEFGFPPKVYPVGRLDHDSEGLLLLTDEPGFTDELLDPSRRHPRTYLVEVENIPSGPSIDKLEGGIIEIEGKHVLPCRAAILESPPAVPDRKPPVRFRKSVPTCWLEITINEGRNRQVRKMTAAIGHPALRLIRIAIGAFEIGDLPLGRWRYVSASQREMIFQRQADTTSRET